MSVIVSNCHRFVVGLYGIVQSSGQRRKPSHTGCGPATCFPPSSVVSCAPLSFIKQESPGKRTRPGMVVIASALGFSPCSAEQPQQRASQSIQKPVDLKEKGTVRHPQIVLRVRRPQISHSYQGKNRPFRFTLRHIPPQFLHGLWWEFLIFQVCRTWFSLHMTTTG